MARLFDKAEKLRSRPKTDLISATIATYNQTANFYEADTAGHLRNTKPLADFFIKNLSSNKVLEIGCGPGYHARYFSQHGLLVTATDFSEKFVAMTRSRAPKAKVLKMDMRKLKFPASHFDGIWAMASFLHIPKNQGKKTLLGFNRVLKSGGLLLISVKLGTGERVISKQYYGGGVRNHRGIKFFAFYKQEEFKRLLESCGFTIIKSLFDENKYGEPFINVFCRKE